MKVPFFDATRDALAEEERLVDVFRRVLRSGRYILGEEVEAFEREVAAFLGVRHAIGVSSGTDALLVALASLGVGPGDEVVVPAYGFVATPEAVARVGAKPVFADVRRADLTLDPEAAAALVSARTRAIVAVHLFGAPADVASLRQIGPPVVEDAAQALGTISDGVRIGALGRVGCFSFFPTKNLGGLGDGGLVVCDDDALDARARSLRSHGRSAPDIHEEIGGNFRLDALQAAFLRSRLPHLERALARRRAIAARYLAGLPSLVEAIEPLVPRAGSTFNQFVIRVAGGEPLRDALRTRLAARGVMTAVYYPRALVDQPCFARFGPAPAPVAVDAARTTLALPCYPRLRDDEVDEVVRVLGEALA